MAEHEHAEVVGEEHVHVDTGADQTPSNENGNYMEHNEDNESMASSDGEEDAKLPEKPAGSGGFTFYNFGYHLIPFHDILDSFYSLRKTYFSHQKKSSSGSIADSKGDRASVTSSKKAFDIDEFQRTKEMERLNGKMTKISRFRPDEPKWDRTSTPDKTLLNTLYRTPDSDPSGKVIFSVVRDEAKDATPWKPPARDRDLPVPTLDKCNPRLQLQILSHMNETIAKVEKEYAKMPCTTQAESTLRANMGADLDNLKRQRDQLLRHMKKKKHSGLKPNALFGV